MHPKIAGTFLLTLIAVCVCNKELKEIENQFPKLPSVALLPDVFPANLLYCCKLIRRDVEYLKENIAAFATKGGQQQQQISSIKQTVLTGMRFRGLEQTHVYGGAYGYQDDAANGHIITGVQNFQDNDTITDEVYRRILQKQINGIWQPVTP